MNNVDLLVIIFLFIIQAYPDPVRVVSIGVPIQTVLDTLQEGLGWEHSIELCGGT